MFNKWNKYLKYLLQEMIEDIKQHGGFSVTSVEDAFVKQRLGGEGEAFSIVYFRHFLIIGVNGFSAAELCVCG